MTIFRLKQLASTSANAALDAMRWNYDRAELIADGVVHGIGLFAGLVAATVLIVLTAIYASAFEIVAVSIYVAGLLTMLVAQYVSPDIDPTAASCVGLAVECLICALDLLDDVEDNDQTLTLQTLGVARTLNVSTTLMLLAQQALVSLLELDGTFAAVEPLLQRTLREAVLVAACGQHGAYTRTRRS